MLLFTPDSTYSVNKNTIGDKAFNLLQLHALHTPIPSWMVVTAHAFEQHIPESILEQSRESIINFIKNCPLQQDLLNDINLQAQHNAWTDKTFCAVRSSAIGEDSAEHSFAGQLESFLYIPLTEIEETIRKVWLSSFSKRVVAYREKNNLVNNPMKVAVIIQEMVNADSAGVSFGIDPVSGDRNATVISSVYGLGEGLVFGMLNADTFMVKHRVTKTGEVTYTIDEKLVEKSKALVFDHENGKYTKTIDVTKQRQANPSLTEKQIREITNLTVQLGNHFHTPQDIEWAMSNSQLYLLQTRPITTLTKTPDTTAPKRIWDNANIVESYAGVTTPLTFSFVQELYTAVYQHFCRIMGVEEEVIQINKNIFNMLGLIKGRIYYNLFNWYQVLSLLPGYAINASFMEQMMGVTEKMEVLPTVITSSKNKYLLFFRLLKKLFYNFKTLPQQIKAFYTLLDQVLSPIKSNHFENLKAHQLKEHYIYLEQSLLNRWQAPLVNDFFAMIFYGILKKIIQKWKLDSSGTLQNDFLSGEGGIISTEPISSMQKIANYIIENPSLHSFINKSSVAEICRNLGLSHLSRDQEVAKEYRKLRSMIITHIDTFGDRCVHELKLETITLKHNPAILIPMLKSYVKAGITDFNQKAKNEYQVRTAAEKKVCHGLKRSPVRRFLFTFILNHTRKLIKNRENLRFERTRLYARVREIFLALGKCLAREKAISEPRDIFYLTKNEIFDFIEGTSVFPELQPIISQRKDTFGTYRNVSLPNRFTTYGMVYQANDFRVSQPSASSGDGQLKGIGCCPGIIKAPVCLVDDPNQAPELMGRILVAQKTDPGWAPLFPLAKALLVERGSLLSHSAIVARGMGIPAVIGIPDLMIRLKDGETVELDGTTGIVTLFRK